MVPRGRAQEELSPEAVEFVRFCYRRRRMGWPELYDEMCAVAGRGSFHGWRHAELEEHGIRFSLFELPALAALVRQVIAEEVEGRGGIPLPSRGGAAAERSEASGVREASESGPAEGPFSLVAASPAG